MPNWEELAQSMGQPFGGVSAIQGSYAGQQYNQPQITPQMLAERLMRQVPQGFMAQPVSTQVTPDLVQKAYGVAEQAGFASGGLLKKGIGLFDVIRSLQPKGQERALVSIAELRAKSGLSPAEFDAQILQLAQEGKVALHQHDFASSLKPAEREKLLAVKDPNAYPNGIAYYVGVVPK